MKSQRILKSSFFYYEIPFPKRFIKCNDGNEKASANGILKLLQNGETVGLCSSAGMPGISDPGFRVIAVAVENNIEIDIIPGPSAMTTALVGSGLPTSSHLFLGFPPRKAIRQKKAFRAREKYSPHLDFLCLTSADKRIFRNCPRYSWRSYGGSC